MPDCQERKVVVVADRAATIAVWSLDGSEHIGEIRDATVQRLESWAIDGDWRERFTVEHLAVGQPTRGVKTYLLDHGLGATGVLELYGQRIKCHINGVVHLGGFIGYLEMDESVTVP